MTFTQLAISGFVAGCGFASVVATLMAGYYATTKALGEV